MSARAAAAKPARAPVRAPRTPTRPRRVSGPAGGARRAPTPPARRARTPPAPSAALAQRVAHGLRALSHQRLDRLIRGRAWIAIIAFALIGIVTLQLGLLQLNARIGRSLQREAALQRQDAALGVEDSNLAAPERVETLAARAGMRPSAESSLRFLGAAGAGIAGKAAAALQNPVGTATSSSSSAGTGSAGTATGTGEAGTSTAPGEAGTSTATGEAAGAASATAPTSTQQAPVSPSGAPQSQTAPSGAQTAPAGVESAGAGTGSGGAASTEGTGAG